MTYSTHLPNIQSGNSVHQVAYPPQPSYSFPSSSFRVFPLFLRFLDTALMRGLVKENFPYHLQQPYGVPLPSPFGAPATHLVPDLNYDTHPLLDLPTVTLDSNAPLFDSIPQPTSRLSAESPPPEQTYPPPDSKFEVVIAEARNWMESHPGEKVATKELEGAYRKIHTDSWECLSCGETRKRRVQIAHHIRGMHLDNRGFYRCDEPGWCAILLSPRRL